MRAMMRRIGGLLVLVTAMLGLSAEAALAQSPSFGTDQNYCDRSTLSQMLSTSRGNLLGTAAGAALGGLLGSKMGKGTGSTIATIVGVVGGGIAGGYIGRSMDPADQSCIGQSLEHTPTNQTVAWQNPDSGSRYWVTPTQTYQGPNGQPCRTYITQAVVNGQTQRSEDAACRQPDGGWQPVALNQNQPPPPPQAMPPASPPSNASAPLSQETVFKVQERLHDLGFYVRDNIDGQWGPRTMEAVSNFQRSRGMNPTGQLDLQTLQALGVI